MATRLVFLPKNSFPWYVEKVVDFQWVPGLAKSQAQKSIKNLHESAINQLNIKNPIEISTKSNSDLGVAFSAFNLKMKINNQNQSSVESIYQSSKVFENGGPYTELISIDSINAKRDSRLKESGKLIGFKFRDTEWKVTYSPNFYDYIYVSALLDNDKRTDLHKYDGFTDIAFNQTSLKFKKNLSFNCQARSICIYLSLKSIYKDTELLEYLKNLTQNNKQEVKIEQLELNF